MRNRVIDNSAQNNLVVHKSGNETILDNKTFTGSTTLSGLTAGSTTLSGLNVTGSTTLSGLTAGSTTLSGLNVTGSTTLSGLTAGSTTLSGLTAGSTTLSGLNVTGNTTLSALTTTYADIIRKINVDVSSIPSNTIYIVPFATENGDGSLKAYQQIAYRNNGNLQNTFGLIRNVNGTNIFNTIDLGIDSSGNATAYAINPESTSNGQNIATTAWVNTFCKTTNRTITAVYGDNTNWRRVWSDGWIEQGGIITGTVSGNTYSVTKTFPQAYQNIPTLLINYLSTKGLGYQTMRALTTTYFTAVATSTGDNYQDNSNGFAYYAFGY